MDVVTQRDKDEALAELRYSIAPGIDYFPFNAVPNVL